jgi:glutamate synthase domain-containing protein 1
LIAAVDAAKIGLTKAERIARLPQAEQLCAVEELTQLRRRGGEFGATNVADGAERAELLALEVRRAATRWRAKWPAGVPLNALREAFSRGLEPEVIK